MLDVRRDERPEGPLAYAAPPPFVVSRHVMAGGATCLTFSGELDLASAETATEHVTAAQDASALVWLDLRGLSFMDSTGLHMIIGAGVRADGHDDRVVVIHGTGPVRRILEVSGMQDLTASVCFSTAEARPRHDGHGRDDLAALVPAPWLRTDGDPSPTGPR